MLPMTWLDLVVLALAGGAVTDTWFNGSIFAKWLALFQLKVDEPVGTVAPDLSVAATPEDAAHVGTPSSPVSGPTDDTYAEFNGDDTEIHNTEEPLSPFMAFVDRMTPRIVAELLTCPFCFSHEAPFWLSLFFWIPGLFFAEPWGSLLRLPLYCLAAARLGWLLNGLLPEHLRYDRTRK